MLSNRGQISDTSMWVVSTIIILVIISSAILLTSLGGEIKETLGLEKSVKINFEKEVPYKSLFAFLLTKNSEGVRIFSKLSFPEGDLNDFSGKLALRIFKNFYGDTFPNIWFGVGEGYFEFRSNEYFGVGYQTQFGSIFIKLNENKWVELILEN